MALKTIRDVPILPGEDSLGGHAKEFQDDRLGLFCRAAREGGDICRLRFFNKPVLVVSAPALLHEMLVEKGRSFSKSVGIRSVLYPLAGEGLFTSDGDLWKRQRKLMAPLFSAAYMENYMRGMHECIDRGIGTWRDGEVIDLGREMTRVTMGIVGKALFDTDTFDEADELGGAISDVLEYLNESGGKLSLIAKLQIVGALEGMDGRVPKAMEGARVSLLQLFRQPLRLPTPRSRRIHKAIRTLDDLVRRMIEERRAVGLSRHDLLTKLLAARDDDDGQTMTDKQVRDEVLTLFFAGHETTAVSTTWTLYMLSRHPEIYRRHREEVDALGGRPITLQDLSILPYTLRVFKESLRLYPPAFILDRQATSDVQIGDYEVPRGTIIFFSPYGIHRRADLFPDPEVFDPERFTPEAEAARERLAYLPFGAGPRICIGIHFALTEAQLLLARLTQRFTLTAVSKQLIPAASAGTLRTKGPIFMQARARKDVIAAQADPT